MDKRTFDEAEGVRAWAREAMARRRAERRRMATRWVLVGLGLAAGLVLRFLGAY